MSYIKMCPYCEMDTAGNHKPGCPNASIKFIDCSSATIDLSGVTNQALGVTNQALLEAEAQRQEIEQLSQWVNDLQSGMYVNCVYCGHRYGPEDEVPTSMADVLKEHVEQCPKHPMSKLKKEIEQQRKVLAKARETILSVFRENPSQENIEFAEHVVAEIDKVLNA